MSRLKRNFGEIMEILCTLGPSSLRSHIIQRMAAEGVDLFRLNLSHMKYENLESAVELIRANSKVPICFDSEGAQIRTDKFEDGKVFLTQNSLVKITNQETLGTKDQFNLYPVNVVERLIVGDLLTLDFNAALLQVINVEKDGAWTKVLNAGWVGSNKAVSSKRIIPLDAFTEKDLKAFELSRKLNIKHVALSFAHRASDVNSLRKLVNPEVKIISKIECLSGLDNLEDIIKASDSILIDRGDLSHEVGVEFIPLWQKKIISTVKSLDKKVYVATNFLESMISNSSPTRAEVNDIYNTLNDGADGLVLAAETAIGKYPIECVGLIHRMSKIFNNFHMDKLSTIHTSKDGSLSLTSPHGDFLKENLTKVAANEVDSTLGVSEEIILDCYQLSTGGYSPLTGFMNNDTLSSVLDKMRTSDGIVWTMPILFQVGTDTNYKTNQRIGLFDEKDKNKKNLYQLKVEEVYKIDLSEVAIKWFGTDSDQHPGVQKLFSKGNQIVAGTVQLIENPEFECSQFLFTPRNIRYILEKKGWTKIVGFHSRNVPHRAHEMIQLLALKNISADGLLISPVLGPKKSGDFTSAAIVEAYSRLLDMNVYPEGQALIAGFNTYSRFCGPREAVFTALCRQNFGCSHFIIGRDHAGVGSFYEKDAAQKIFEKLAPDMEITPIFFEEFAYCQTEKKLLPTSLVKSAKNISGTSVRETLMKKESLPDWFMRPQIQKLIQDKIQRGEKVFI